MARLLQHRKPNYVSRSWTTEAAGVDFNFLRYCAKFFGYGFVYWVDGTCPIDSYRVAGFASDQVFRIEEDYQGHAIKQDIYKRGFFLGGWL